MSNGTGRYLYAGHAIGAAARFDRLYDSQGLNHVSPTWGAAVLPITGGRSECAVSEPQRFRVEAPSAICLLGVDRVNTWVEGRDADGGFETELGVEIDGFQAVEKLFIASLRLHMRSTRAADGDPVVATDGNRIDGVRLGNVEARVTIDDEPLRHAGTADELVSYYRSLGQDLPQCGEAYRCSIVREIQLIGEERDKQPMSVVDGHTIVWEGFGRIILGEIHVKGHDRRLTLVRLAMGSDAGGTGTGGGGQSNGTLGTG